MKSKKQKQKLENTWSYKNFLFFTILPILVQIRRKFLPIMYKLIFFVLFVQIFSYSKSLGGEPYYLISISSQDTKSDFKNLQNLSYDVVEKSNSKITLVVSKEDLSNFKEYTILDEAKTRPPAGYKTLPEVEKSLIETSKKYPVITKLVDLSQKYLNGRRTVQNNTIWGLKISKNASQDLDKPYVLILATHHARETINAELVLTIIKDMTENYGKDPNWTKFVNDFNYLVIPVVNPDGYDYVFNRNTMWRKNLFKGYGIDLNRNYEMGWNSRCGGSTMTSSQTYRGEKPFSEIETQTIHAITMKHPFAKVLDFHSFGRIVFAGYSFCTPGPKSMNDYILREGAKLARAANYSPPPIEDTDGMHVSFLIF